MSDIEFNPEMEESSQDLSEVKSELQQEVAESKYKDDPKLQAALKFGWKDLPDFNGDPDEHFSPSEFMRNRNWDLQLRSLKDELKNVTKASERLIEHNKKVEKLGHERGLEEARREFEDAVLYGKTDDALKASEKVKDFETKLKSPDLSSPSNVPPEIQEWGLKNSSWLNSQQTIHKSMQVYAQNRIAEIAQQNPGVPPSHILQMVDSELHNNFPTAFDQPAKSIESKRAEARVSSVEGGTPTALNTNKQLSYDGLPAYVRSDALTFKKTLKNFDEKLYIEQARKIHGV